MQKAAKSACKRIQKLVREYVGLESRLLKLAFKLKSFHGLRPEICKAYLDATLRSPEEAAEEVWTVLAEGDERAEFYDIILMNLSVDAKLFHVADAILKYCNEKGWGEQVQSALSEDVKEMLAASGSVAHA